MIKLILSALCVFAISFSVSSQSALWKDVPDPKRENQQIRPATFRTMTVDFESLKALLLDAPAQGSDFRNSEYTLQLPTPDGGRTAFRIAEESIMAPELQARYPEIRTYAGLGTGEYATATISLDFTLKGFHAQILMGEKTYYIDPLSSGDLNTYIIYTREAFYKNNNKKMSSCEPENIGAPQPGNSTLPAQQETPGDIIFPQVSNGTELRTYELALACTGEYAQYHGGTVPLVMSAMTTTMNRVNGIYRSDLCLRMLLIADNDDLIFLDAATDGYSNNNGSAMLGENQTKIDLIIGSSNYDIGHVFSTGGGGVASLGVVCNNNSKARGVTGQANPIGDPFDVDYVSHEMGHQWDADHTQNNPCNRVASSAFEPGSASTIMGYAGICSPNLQNNSNAYFHNRSYNQIVNYSVNGAGNSCATITSAINTPPVVFVPSGGFSIPKSTPFELTAIASDQNNDALTYCWEQYDLGPATSSGDDDLSSPNGNAPIFRSWSPTSSPTRVFPRISDLVNNTTVIGEHLPAYERDLTFKCTVRDAYINGAVNDAEVAFDVANNSGPFLVTFPNSATSWNMGSTQTVTWNVANTTSAPVSCSSVDIYLSTDGGFTYPTLLISNTPNDGSQSVVVPNVETTQARIKVKASSNIFFDISNDNFTISDLIETPANDEICDAIAINCGEELTGTTLEATPSSLGDPSCSSGTDNDVFYKFSATEGNIYTITVNGDNYDGVLAIYSGFCTGTLTEIECADNGLSSGIAETITFTATDDSQIFIQTYDWAASAGNFTISLNCVFGNDNPCDAQVITCGETINSSTTGATTSSVGSPSCSEGSENDVFYKMEAIAGVDYTVTVVGNNYDGVLAAYSGSCSGTLVQLACSDAGLESGVIETITFSTGTNQIVFIQTYDYFTSGGEFTLEVSCTNIPNDDPCDARNLVCGESFTGSSAGATPSTMGNPTCAFGSQKDVFFTFSALANTPYTVTVNGDTYDGVLAAYTGDCDGLLTQLDCSDSGLSAGISESVDILVPTDQVIIIQTYDYSSFGQSDFTITLNCPIPDNDDCADATTLLVNNPGLCPANQTAGTTYGATASSPDACETTSPDVYYVFNSGENNEVTIHLDNITATDLVLSIFEASCSAESSICYVGTNQSQTVNVQPSTTYYVRVHSLSGGYAGSFNICLEGTSPPLATINGNIPSWNSNCAERDITVSLINTATSDTYTSTTVLTTSATFEINNIDIPAGTYDILVKVEGALAVLSEDVVLSAGANTFNVGPLVLGDINNNNVINVLDLSVFSASFGTTSGSPGYNFLADLNCDGVINIFDVSILGAGFNQVGDNLPLP